MANTYGNTGWREMKKDRVYMEDVGMKDADTEVVDIETDILMALKTFFGPPTDPTDIWGLGLGEPDSVVAEPQGEVIELLAGEEDKPLAYQISTAIPTSLVATTWEPASAVAEPLEDTEGLVVVEETSGLRAEHQALGTPEDRTPEDGNPAGEGMKGPVAVIGTKNRHHMMTMIRLKRMRMRNEGAKDLATVTMAELEDIGVDGKL